MPAACVRGVGAVSSDVITDVIALGADVIICPPHVNTLKIAKPL